jgi:hypothetical protein
MQLILNCFKPDIKKMSEAPDYFSSLPDSLHGRIGDFLTLEDRNSVRLQSRQLSSLYKYTVQQSFRLRQRITYIDLQSRISSSSFTTRSKVISRRKDSLMIGTKKKIIEFIEDMDWKLIEAQKLDEILDNTEFIRGALSKLHRYALENAALYPHVESEWNLVVHSIIYKLFQHSNQFSSVFSDRGAAEELQDAIFSRARNPENFPFTFIKTREINILDNNNFLKTIEALMLDVIHNTNFVNEWIQLLINYLGVPNRESPIEGLRDQLNFRVISEIYVDLL